MRLSERAGTYRQSQDCKELVSHIYSCEVYEASLHWGDSDLFNSKPLSLYSSTSKTLNIEERGMREKEFVPTSVKIGLKEGQGWK